MLASDAIGLIWSFLVKEPESLVNLRFEPKDGEVYVVGQRLGGVPTNVKSSMSFVETVELMFEGISYSGVKASPRDVDALRDIEAFVWDNPDEPTQGIVAIQWKATNVGVTRIGGGLPTQTANHPDFGIAVGLVIPRS